MKVLQIANDFSTTKVHVNLFKCLDDLGVEQIIFSPVRAAERIGGNYFDGKHSDIIYANVVKPFHKYVYHIKRKHVCCEMLKRINIKNIDLCHATTLFTDGGLAYLLYKKYHIPYVVAVRNTDVNGFLQVLPHTWYDGIQILLHAKKIFFISEGLKKRFENHFVIRPFLNRIKNKFVWMPNGIDDYFLDHISYEKHKGHKVVYVGDFSDNKNVCRLGEAILELRSEQGFEDTTLTLVGGGNNKTDKVEKMIQSNDEAFTYLGKIYDKQKLCEVFKHNTVFAMPSIHETFGLVYVEALSQNLPVLYTKGQGIDGLFDDSVGIAVNPLSVEDITGALRELLSNENYGNDTVDFNQFRWVSIAEKYLDIYRKISI